MDRLDFQRACSAVISATALPRCDAFELCGREMPVSEFDDTLHGPEQSDDGDGRRGENDEACPIPRLVAIPHRDGKESSCNHGELRELYADVEADQSRN